MEGDRGPFEDLEMRKMKAGEASGSGGQSEYDNSKVEERPLIEDLNGDNQDSTEGAGSSVSGPSQESVVEGVREAITKTPHEAPGGGERTPLDAAVSGNIYHTNKITLAEFIREKFGEEGLYLGRTDSLVYANFEYYVEERKSGNILYRQ